MRWKDMFTLLRILETISHRMTGLSLMWVTFARAIFWIAIWASAYGSRHFQAHRWDG